ncbi:MAG: iron-containing redox enzyme family protein [Spirochaetota bacterium]
MLSSNASLALLMKEYGFFDRFKEMDDAELRRFIESFYILVREFPRQLGFLIARAPNKLTLFVLADNLVDELGGPEKLEKRDFSAMHTELLRGLGRKVGITDEEFETLEPNLPTQRHIMMLEKAYQEKSFIEAAAYIAGGMESVFPEIAKRIYVGLSSRFSEIELIHFSTHMTADVEHDQAFRDCLFPMMENDEAAREQFRRGALECARSQRHLGEQLFPVGEASEVAK